jgi:adenosylhomocysteine nucleosidase
MLAATLALALLSPAASPVVVLVSANAEWRVVREAFPSAVTASSPFGEFFSHRVAAGPRSIPIVVFHGGWGKISAAASTQYAIDRWRPRLLINLGTCGGFRGEIGRTEVILVDRTVVYDIVEQMGDASQAIADYSTDLDLAWATKGELPTGVRRGLLLSADRDILPADVPRLRAGYRGVAADWESGAIAYVARANRTPALILRGVSDLVGEGGGEAYGNEAVFEEGTRRVMTNLIGQLPFWLSRWESGETKARR